MFPGIQVFVC